jgi:hypothetical protein
MKFLEKTIGYKPGMKTRGLAASLSTAESSDNRGTTGSTSAPSGGGWAAINAGNNVQIGKGILSAGRLSVVRAITHGQIADCLVQLDTSTLTPRETSPPSHT